MFAEDHAPPHFHAVYGEHEVLIRIEDGEIIRGGMPRRPLRLVHAWLELHREELVENWKQSREDSPEFKKIEPLR
jgi:hypothetical protein